MDEERDFPTMIIPSGTEITVNEQGQLAIKTPGNLVIQNPGVYSVIECTRGSVRIDPNVKVEAVSIEAADTCYVAGTLSAWRVRAKKVILEKSAQAFIMLRESESLDLDRTARLVGNFNSPSELYLMLGRFNQQLRELPQLLTPSEAPHAELGVVAPVPAVEAGHAEAPPPPPLEEPFLGVQEPPISSQEQAETLALAQLVLQRELAAAEPDRPNHDPLARLLDLARSQGIAGLRAHYVELFGRLHNPSASLQRVKERLDRLFGAPGSWIDDAPAP